MTDWKKRARELMLAQMPSGDGEEYFEQYICGEIAISAALQLGQEMQAEAREILYEKIVSLEMKVEALEELRTKAADVRAEEIAKAIEALRGDHGAEQRGWIIGLRDAARLARSMGAKKQTREDVLEEALRQIGCSCGMTEKYRRPIDDIVHAVDCTYYVARRALEEADRLRSS